MTALALLLGDYLTSTTHCITLGHTAVNVFMQKDESIFIDVLCLCPLVLHSDVIVHYMTASCVVRL